MRLNQLHNRQYVPTQVVLSDVLKIPNGIFCIGKSEWEATSIDFLFGSFAFIMSSKFYTKIRIIFASKLGITTLIIMKKMERDQQIFDLIHEEHERQVYGIELIASENFVSNQVMEATGSCLTNKYAEGYPNKGIMGLEAVDEVEQ